MINVKVKANQTENSTTLLRRFTKRVQSAKILSTVKSARFKERAVSPLIKKKNKLKRMEKKKKILKMLKLGYTPKTKRSKRRG